MASRSAASIRAALSWKVSILRGLRVKSMRLERGVRGDGPQSLEIKPTLNYGAAVFTPADLLMAERHIAEGEEHILSQEQIITTLCLNGADTDFAEKLLAEFQATLRTHREDRDRIAAELGR